MIRPPLFTLALAALAGCTDVTTLVVVTDAPPGRVAEVDPEDQTIHLSTGVAVAVECFFRPADADIYVPQPGYACDSLTLEALADDEDEPLIDIVPAHLEGSPWMSPYRPAAGYSQTNQTGADRAVFVLVGRRPGTGQLLLTHEEAELSFLLEVFPGEGGP